MGKLKILIVGAGVAGLTLAKLLEKQGLSPFIIERDKETDFNQSGYMLGLLPLGGRVLNSLDLREDYFRHSIQMENYEIHSANGKLIKKYPLDFINKTYGSYRGISRVDLINILNNKSSKNKIKFNTTLVRLTQRENCVEVQLSNAEKAIFDLVVIADGVHSPTRKMILSENEFAYKDTDWGGWVTWLPQFQSTTYQEYWGNSSFLGLYPVKGKTGVFLGGPMKLTQKMGLPDFKNKVKNKITINKQLPHRALDAFDKEKSPFFWNFQDGRSKIWHKRNVILLGDAATGFIPTAGVGASMAMDSAATLADEISRMDKSHIEYGLNIYVHRQKNRAEKAQSDSRNMGKLMFINSKIKASIRDRFIPFYSLKRMLADLGKVMDGR